MRCHHALVGAIDPAGRSPLHYAALADDADEARRQIESGADVNVAGHDGSTSLHLAAQEGSLRVARLLLDAGADVDAPNAAGNTPLFVAVFNSRGRGDMIELLRARGADRLATNKAGQTPTGLSRLIANYDVRRFLDEAG